MRNISVGKSGTFSGHRDCIYSLEAGGDNIFFSAAGDGLVVEWNLSEPDMGKLVAKVANSVYALHFLREKNRLLIGQNFEGLHLIDLNTKKEIISSKITNSAIFDIISYKDRIFAGTGEGVLYVQNVDDLSVLAKLKLSDKSLRTLAIDTEGNFLVAGFSDNFIKVIDLKSLKVIRSFEAHKNSVFSLKFSPDGKYLLSGSRDAHLNVWDVEGEYSPVNSIVAHMYAINHIAYNKNGTLFATCSMDKAIKIWDATEFRLLKVIDKARHAGHGTSVNKLCWSAPQDVLISCSDDRLISVWDLKIKEKIE
ncbi:MAG: WD40 repeat domain-containing protein [Cytophagaceae bacterium]